MALTYECAIEFVGSLSDCDAVLACLDRDAYSALVGNIRITVTPSATYTFEFQVQSFLDFDLVLSVSRALATPVRFSWQQLHLWSFGTANFNQGQIIDFTRVSGDYVWAWLQESSSLCEYQLEAAFSLDLSGEMEPGAMVRQSLLNATEAVDWLMFHDLEEYGCDACPDHDGCYRADTEDQRSTPEDDAPLEPRFGCGVSHE